MKLSSKIGVAELPNSKPRYKMLATVGGWGQTQNHRWIIKYPRILQKLIVTIMDEEYCRRIYNRTDVVCSYAVTGDDVRIHASSSPVSFQCFFTSCKTDYHEFNVKINIS